MDALATVGPACLGRRGGMDAHPDLRCEPVHPPVLGQFRLDGDGTSDRCARLVEGDEEPVPRVIHFHASMLSKE